jgi:hypothetical protein
MALVHDAPRDCVPPTDHDFHGISNESEIHTTQPEFASGPLSHRHYDQLVILKSLLQHAVDGFRQKLARL